MRIEQAMSAAVVCLLLLIYYRYQRAAGLQDGLRRRRGVLEMRTGSLLGLMQFRVQVFAPGVA